MKTRKILKENMVITNLHTDGKFRGPIRVDGRLLQSIGRGKKCQAYEILSEAEMIRHALSRTTEIVLR